MFHGVIAGDMPLMGLGTEPKNIPVAANGAKLVINITFLESYPLLLCSICWI